METDRRLRPSDPALKETSQYVVLDVLNCIDCWAGGWEHYFQWKQFPASATCVMITHGCSDQQVRPSVIALSRQTWQGESPSAISAEQMSSRELTRSAQVNSNANGSTFEQVILGWNRLSFFCLRSQQARTFVCSENEVGHLSFVSCSSR